MKNWYLFIGAEHEEINNKKEAIEKAAQAARDGYQVALYELKEKLLFECAGCKKEERE